MDRWILHISLNLCCDKTCYISVSHFFLTSSNLYFAHQFRTSNNHPPSIDESKTPLKKQASTSLGYTIMCVALEQRHFQCGHLKKVIITTQCDNALRSGKTCRKSQCVLLEGETVSLPLCVICYRKTEKVICDEADEAIRRVTECADNFQRLLNDPDSTSSAQYQTGDLAVNAAELTHGVLDRIRRERQFKLSEFRKSQGVWGDG